MTTPTAAAAVLPPGQRKRSSAILRELRHSPACWLALAWLAIVIFVSAMASNLGLPDPKAQTLSETFALPSAEHWLGTDSLGRDILSRIAHGGGELLLVALIPIGVSFLLGVPLGMLAGYVGGAVDSVVAFVVNVLFSIPGIVVILAVAAATNNNLASMMLVMGVAASGGIVRLARASTISSKNLLYVDAARVAQLSRGRILLRHILPNVASPLVVQAFLGYGGMFVLLTALAFLSLGFNPEDPNWGQLTLEASRNISQHPWLMVPIGAVLILTILSINTVGSALLRALPTQDGGQDQGKLVRIKQRVAKHTATAEAEAGTAPASDALLRLEGISVTIPGARGDEPLVNGVSLEVHRGQTLALVGESGSGKTLTALATVKLLPREALVSGGRIFFDGVEVSALDERKFRRFRGRKIAFVSQEPLRALDPCYTIGSQLVEAIRAVRGLSSSAAHARAAELLEMVGIVGVAGVLRSYPHQLSGGMAQRVAIALAISGEPELIIADEPTTALDVTVQAEILDLLHDIQERLGLALVIVTHDFGVVADVADTVAVMQLGQIVEFGTTREVMASPKHPYTAQLIRAADYEDIVRMRVAARESAASRKEKVANE